MPESRHLPGGDTPERVLAGELGRLARQVADLRATVLARGRRFPTVTTAGRPSASAVGAGAYRFDTTIGKPIWSTGSVWVDATGATV